MNRILIVDDSPDMLDVFPWILQKKGYSTATTYCRKGLFSQLAKFIPSLIILDVKLSDENGRDICKEIKSNETLKNIPVFICSGNPESLSRPEECGADDILEKPLEMQIVISKIERVLQQDYHPVYLV